MGFVCVDCAYLCYFFLVVDVNDMLLAISGLVCSIPTAIHAIDREYVLLLA